LTGVQIDEACKDVSRLCFLSYDPDVFHNPNAQELAPLPEPERPKATINGIVDLSERQRIATELLGKIDWQSETSGYVACPGKHLHTTGDNDRDCAIHLDSVPTLHCFHNSCRGILDGVNHALRSRVAKAEYVRPQETKQPAEDQLKAVTVKTERVLQGSEVLCPEVELWPEAIDGGAVLSDIAASFARYVALPDGAPDALALWCAHTYCFDLFQHSPRLNITSPEKSCGKSTLRDVIALLVNRPLCLDSLTTAVTFRLLDKRAPTLLADEADAWLIENEELRGAFNAGHSRSGLFARCEGEGNEVEHSKYSLRRPCVASVTYRAHYTIDLS
jgi:hypothetical protein